MTPIQLERAARHYCKLTNTDPDEPLKLKQPMPGANGPIDTIPRWRPISNAIRDQINLLEAISVGMEDSEVPEKSS